MRYHILFIIIVFFHLAKGQQQHIISSEIIPAPDTVWVFPPTEYTSGKEYPVVYLLHGWSGNYQQWSNITDIQAYADKYGFIIVCPDGFYDSWYLNSPENIDWQYKDYFFQSLLPFINKKYSVDKSKVFISGLSMGGHGAFYLFSQRPDIFLSAGSSSGVLDLRHQQGNYGLARILGKYSEKPDQWKQASVVSNLLNIKKSNKPIIFDCGTGDSFYDVNNRFRQLCDSLKIPATYISQPGKHNADYWKKSIPFHFDFFNNIITLK